MREGLVRINQAHRQQLSNDLGALAGLMFDVGNGRYAAPPRLDDPDAMSQSRALWEADLNKVREESSAAQKQWLRDAESDATHTDIQGRLRDLGLALGFDVWIASNDRGRTYGGGRLGDGCLADLPVNVSTRGDAVRLIDVIWLEKGAASVAAAFEVEHSTSIYSGIVRMLDLALGSDVGASSVLFLVAPDSRRDEVKQQLARPAFSRVSELGIRYLPYGELQKHRDAIARFGSGIKPIIDISQRL